MKQIKPRLLKTKKRKSKTRRGRVKTADDKADDDNNLNKNNYMKKITCRSIKRLMLEKNGRHWKMEMNRNVVENG